MERWIFYFFCTVMVGLIFFVCLCESLIAVIGVAQAGWELLKRK